MEKYNKIITRLKEQRREVEDNLLSSGYVEGVDYIFEGIYLQGSQNYGADHENSDVDSKYVLIPTVKSLLRGTNFVKDVSVSNNEKVSVKPFLKYVELFFKGNVNNLEMLFTDYSVVNHDLYLLGNISFSHKEAIVQATKKTVSDAIIGMMLQKQKSMYKGTETTQHFVEELGYDPKDVQHIVRLGIMYESLFKKNKSFAESLKVPAEWQSIVQEYIYKKNLDMFAACERAIECVREIEEEAKPENDPVAIENIKESIAEMYETEYDYLLQDKYKCHYCN